MIVRNTSESDIPQIISLLKASLGESLLPKSEDYWKWKHVNNPFGESPVLVAEENGVFIGVRAFMRWRWESQKKSLEAVRAVDTATHPNFQGKGIFSRLTTTLLSTCKENQWHLVFNTPNKKSLPGYLKMGWKEAGNLPLEIKVVRPLSLIADRLTRSNGESPTENETLTYFLGHRGLADLVNAHKKRYPLVFRTAYSLQYIRWRYSENPVARYHAAGIESGNNLSSLFIYRIKSTKWGRELRIGDLFLLSMNDLERTSQLLDEKIKYHRAHFVTFAADDFALFKGMLRFKTKTLGPVVTVRDILPDQSEDFINFQKWSPSLGDMELF